MLPDDDAARVLSETLDEETMNKTDDDADLKLNKYDPVQAWIQNGIPNPRRGKPRSTTTGRATRTTWCTASTTRSSCRRSPKILHRPVLRHSLG